MVEVDRLAWSALERPNVEVECLNEDVRLELTSKYILSYIRFISHILPLCYHLSDMAQPKGKQQHKLDNDLESGA